jgi:hypothetical protein
MDNEETNTNNVTTINHDIITKQFSSLRSDIDYKITTADKYWKPNTSLAGSHRLTILPFDR